MEMRKGTTKGSPKDEEIGRRVSDGGGRPKQQTVASKRVAGGAIALALVAFGFLIASLLPAFHQSCPPPDKVPFAGTAYGREAARNLSNFRSGLLAQIIPQYAVPHAEMTPGAVGLKRFDFFNPIITCPPHLPRERYGGSGDGGKILCSVSNLEPPCLIYSVGSMGDFSFELAMLNATKCDVHTFDCTFDGKSLQARHTYHKTCIGVPRDGSHRHQYKTYPEMMASLGHTRVDLLKVDIEGFEYQLFSSLTPDTPNLPHQISTELHYLLPEFRHVAVPRTPLEMALVFLHFANLGYAAMSREDNPILDKGCCSEYTFLRVEDRRAPAAL